LIPFIESAVEPGAIVHTDGWQAYWTVPERGYEHERTIMPAQHDPAHVLMPGVHRVASLLKRWLLGTHQGSVGPEHLDAYLNEFRFRFNRRGSGRRGLLFYRLLEQGILADPINYRSLIVNPRPGRPRQRCPSDPRHRRPSSGHGGPQPDSNRYPIWQKANAALIAASAHRRQDALCHDTTGRQPEG
jgi:ISXO2-like transposase domain